ncbi:MAG: transglutaminase domain-containing protein [archaeon]|nr:MAG: transglutaminase domain-containing protein [archaeon]
MKKLVIIFLLILLTLTLVQAQEIKEYSKINVEISNTVEATDKLDVNLLIFPRQTDNQFATIHTIPTARVNDKISFSLDGGGSFLVLADVEIEPNIPRITYLEPLTNNGYTQETEHIDSENKYIKNKAQQLQDKAENNLELLYYLAEYVKNNLRYRLEYSQPQKASWILEHKIGVCSHYTTLFIALARSLGFSARYVSGLAYSNEHNSFEEHAWAEVWINNKWIPYDTTFGQYGWLDSRHVILKYSKDSAESSAEYSYTGFIDAEKIEIRAEILDEGSNKYLPFELKAKLHENQVKQGSYVPLEVEIENKNDFYFNLPVYLTTAPGVYGDNTKIAFLEPNSKTKVFFIIEVPELDRCRNGCSGAVKVKDIFDNADETTISFSNYYSEITLEQAQDLIESQNGQTKFDFICSSDREFYYSGENMQISCIVFSDQLEDFEVCLDTCYEFSNKDFVNVEFTTEAEAVLCPKIKQDGEVKATACINSDVVDRPEVRIESIVSEPVEYGEDLNIKIRFSSNVDTYGDIYISEDQKSIASYDTDIARGINEVIIETTSLRYKPGLNELEVGIFFFYDEETLSTSQEFILNIQDVNFFQKFLLFFRKLFI